MFNLHFTIQRNTMRSIQALQNVDVYLLDQALKNRLNASTKILDAGCGSGRNFSWLANEGMDISGFDPNASAIAALRETWPRYAHALHVSTIEEFETSDKFEFIICNAVLHFAESHEAFQTQFARLVQLLVPGGILFVRMTTSMGMGDSLNINEKGVCTLPDTSVRYVLTRTQIDHLLKEHKLRLLEPIKTVLVEQLRSMAVMVFTHA